MATPSTFYPPFQKSAANMQTCKALLLGFYLEAGFPLLLIKANFPFHNLTLTHHGSFKPAPKWL